MTAVTTSRKPDPEIRALGRDFAIAAGASFFTRGKMNLSGALQMDDVVFVMGQEGRRPVIDLYDHGRQILHLAVSGIKVVERTGNRRRGVGVADRSIYQILCRYIGTFPLDERESLEEIVFDGRGRRRYFLTLGQ
ncbi:MAG: Brix domain-containing protein [Methanoculleaceae archaeon]